MLTRSFRSPHEPQIWRRNGLVSFPPKNELYGFSEASRLTRSNRLVATLGAKSNTKKLTRKAILDVDVRKACETIMEPEAPMALRLQSNLLYGVSRVYSQQCGYVLADTQAAQNNMRALLKVAKNNDLDPEVGKAR
jgi:hypothetical protein